MTTYLNSDEVRAQPQWLPKRAGGVMRSWVTTGQNATVQLSGDVLRAAPVYLPETMRIAALVASITAGAAGTGDSMRIGLYTDLNGYPDVLLDDSGLITTTVTTDGQTRSIIGLRLPQGFYWMVTWFDVASVVQPTLQADSTTAGTCMNWLGHTSATDITSHAGISVAFDAVAGLPTPFTAGGVLATTALPRLNCVLGKDGHLTHRYDD